MRVEGENHQSGIIPAYAGSTAPAFILVRGSPDHPRIRGEHVMPSRNVNGVTGSSPHTRGALLPRPSESILVRIIPAYAGSTPPWRASCAVLADHPRIRGEHKCESREKTTRPGSSPHTRGALGAWRTRPASPGIIPAYAGSTAAL